MPTPRRAVSTQRQSMNDRCENLSAVAAPLADRKLPSLAAALHAATVRDRLVEHLPESELDGGAPGIELLKHTPGKRCVIAYDFATRHGRRRVIGKLYRRERGQAIFANMRKLWQAAQCATPRFHLPRPLAYVAEWGMVLQEAAPGIRADYLLHHGTFAQTVAATARNLAALHRLDLDLESRNTLALHLQKYCHPGLEHLMADLPEARRRLAALAAQLLSDGSLAAMKRCPVHGDLGLTQIFHAEDHVSFIDFDGLCRSHAALDLCNFIIVLKTHLGRASDRMIALFLEQYDRLRPLGEIEGVRQYQALIYLRRAMIAWRHRLDRDWRAQALACLTAAEHALDQRRSFSDRHPAKVSFHLFGERA